MPDFQRLVDAFAPSARVVSTTELTGGVSAITTCLTLSGGEWSKVVVRRFESRDWKDVGDLPREHALLRRLHTHGIPVPEPLHLDADGAALGTPALVMAFVDGTTDVGEAGFDAARMADALAAVHEVPFESGEIELPDRHDPRPELREWVSATQWASMGPALDRALAPPATPTVLHGDFWPGNVMWRDGRIAAILDWEDSAYGDPHSDLATARVELHAMASPSASRTFTERYAALRPVDAGRLLAWDLYVSVAALTFMHAWGLPSEVEARRRAVTEGFRDDALARLLR